MRIKPKKCKGYGHADTEGGGSIELAIERRGFREPMLRINVGDDNRTGFLFLTRDEADRLSEMLTRRINQLLHPGQ